MGNLKKSPYHSDWAGPDDPISLFHDKECALNPSALSHHHSHCQIHSAEDRFLHQNIKI